MPGPGRESGLLRVTPALERRARRLGFVSATATSPTPEFVALAQQVSGQNLGPFFKAWLDTQGRPPFLPEPAAAAARRVAADGAAGGPTEVLDGVR